MIDMTNETARETDSAQAAATATVATEPTIDSNDAARSPASDTTQSRPADSGAAAVAEHRSAAAPSISTTGQQRFLTVCLIAALLFLTGQWCWLSLQRPEPLPWRRGASFTEFFRVDINRATWVEWIQLPGIGETMAHRIVADREFNGPFGTIEDLLRVDGIGPVTLRQIRPWLTAARDADAAVAEPSSATTR